MTGVSIRGRVAYPTFGLDLELDAAPGQVVGVVGPNGAGKTTLLRAIAGLTALTEGSITIDGTTVDDSTRALFVPPEQRAVGYVFQNYRLFPHLTVRDNIAFAPRSQGLRRPAARAVADRWIERFGLHDLAGRKPRELSGGQAQRVALARALAAEPAVLLLDEPLAALDAETRLGTRSELRRHLQDFGGVTLLITHDPLEAMVLTDRLIVIEDGRIVQQGTPAEIARRPATHYVARLVGLNLYRGTQADGHVELEGGGTLATASTSDGPSAAIGDDVLVALRPNAITIHTERPEHSSPRNIWPGTVTALELLTDRIRAQVEGQPSSLVDLTPDAVAELQLSEGSSVWLSAKATDIDTYLRT
jgi:molybdate transport system ATP-binding protein